MDAVTTKRRHLATAGRLLAAAAAGAPEDMARFGLTRGAAVKMLGYGANGTAFELPNGMVLKMTSDPAEPVLAKAIIAHKKPVRGFPEVYYTSRIHTSLSSLYSRSNSTMFLIVMERAVPRASLPKTVRQEFDRVVHELQGMRDATRSPRTLDEQAKSWRADILAAGRFLLAVELGREEYRATDNEIAYLLTEAGYDVHGDNMGLVERDGRLMAVILDLGQSTGRPEDLESRSRRVTLGKNSRSRR